MWSYFLLLPMFQIVGQQFKLAWSKSNLSNFGLFFWKIYGDPQY